MDDKPPPFTSIAGASHGTAEPAETTTTTSIPNASSSTAASQTTTPVEPSSTSSSSSATTKPATTTTTTSHTPATKKSLPKRTISANNSPAPSREASPVRPPLKTTGGTSNNTTTSRSAGGRSRKNSAADVSPVRAHTNPPSAAAQQRVLSATTTPILQPASSEPTIKAPLAQKPSAVAPELKDTPRWPVSPRLRSPPPINKPGAVLPRKLELETPSISVQKSSPPPPQAESQEKLGTEADEDALSTSGMRAPARGASNVSSTLETVQETSQPNTPAPVANDGKFESGKAGGYDTDNPIDSAFAKLVKPKLNNESGSESGGKGDIKMTSTTVPPPVVRPSPATKAYSTNTTSGRGKASGEGSTRNMTVETETVSSIPQIAVGGVGGVGNNGSIRTKPSSETIRPKKDKKKTARKTPSVTSGTGEPPYSSRPRQHHHHTATREDPAESIRRARSPERPFSQGLLSPEPSDGSPEKHSRSSALASRSRRPSVYNVSSLLTRPRLASSKADIFEQKVASAVDEANSSDSEETFVYESNPPEASDRPRRFHSRTPSATSMASQLDRQNGGRSHGDGGHSVAMKRSMKFANSYSANATPEMAAGEDDGKGTVRSNMGTGRGSSHHHHIGRWGRNHGNGHPSLFDNESPFPNAAKSKFAGTTPRLSSRPTSPRFANRAGVNGRKSPFAPYDMEDAADDERTPLIPSVRSNRSGRNRRHGPASLRQLEHQEAREDKSVVVRFSGCLVLLFGILLVVSAAAGFMYATTQPLSNVKILALKDVLASEQDLILAMKVEAMNSNVVAVNIESTDLVIFAKSKYAGTNNEWWKKPNGGHLRWAGRVRDAERDTEPTSPNLEIGHVYELDSPLTFEGSPFKQATTWSTGQIRITHPGNATTPAGSERWGRVVAHEFDLIVRGTLKYVLPLSGRVRSVSVEGRVMVKPNAADQDPDTAHTRLEPLRLTG